MVLRSHRLHLGWLSYCVKLCFPPVLIEFEINTHAARTYQSCNNNWTS